MGHRVFISQRDDLDFLGLVRGIILMLKLLLSFQWNSKTTMVADVTRGTFIALVLIYLLVKLVERRAVWLIHFLTGALVAFFFDACIRRSTVLL